VNTAPAPQAKPEPVPLLPESPVSLATNLPAGPLAIPAPTFSPPLLLPEATLAGEWLYVPANRAKDDALYPPEYIELRIREEAGVLSGKYEARYRISDQAISPTVAFRFHAAAEGLLRAIPWTGAGGAHGRLSLRPLPDGALEVTWVADHLGTEMGLISGTATLIRKLE
jgi:hypothetical protein